MKKQYLLIYVLGCTGMGLLGLILALHNKSHHSHSPHPLAYWKGFPSTPQQVISIPGRPYKTLAFPLKEHSFYGTSITKEGYFLYPCGLNKNADSPIGICLIDPTQRSLEATERIIADPKAEQGDLFDPQGDGPWIVFGREGKILQIVARNLETGERTLIGQIESEQIHHPAGPFYAISGTSVVWVDEREETTLGRLNILKAFNLTTRTDKILLELPPQHEIDRVAIDGDRIVYSEVDLSKPGNTTSDVYLYTLSTGEKTRLTHTGQASQPRISFPFVVWKTNTHFSSGGGIYLHNIINRQGNEIVRDDGFPNTYDWPSVSLWGITYIQNGGAAPVWLYHWESNQSEVLDEAGGLTELAGHYVVWASHSTSTPTPGTACLFWADLLEKT